MTLDQVWILFAMVAALGVAQFCCGVATGRSIAQWLRHRVASARSMRLPEGTQRI